MAIGGNPMTKLRTAWVVGTAAVLLAAGAAVMMDSSVRASSRKAEQGGGSGEIAGKVYFKGEAPRLRRMMMDKDPVCASLHPEGVLPEDGRVNANGTLPNAFVYVSKGADNLSGAAPTEAITLTQNECEYEPHVLGIMVGQPLRVVSNDPTTHNIHIMPKAGHDFDVTQQPGSPPVTDKFSKPQIMVPVHCNIHNWMQAYIGVVTNPYYAVTGNEGTFQIKGVPAGSYTLSIWTATFGTQEREVTVRPGETASADFTFGGR
jgi:plastocyanin